MVRPLVHIGYIKAASTFLQERVFADPRFGFAEPAPQARLVIADRLQLVDGWTWNANEHRADFAVLNAKVNEVADGLVPVWSEERLLGDPVQNLYDGAVTAERLATMMPEARILIVVREQRDFALSVYKEIIHDGQSLTLTDVIGTGRELAGFRSRLREDFLRFGRACARYRALFGEDGVLILPLELLREDPDAFLRRVQDFAGVGLDVCRTAPAGRAHVGAGAASLSAVRRLNHLRRPSPRGHPGRLTDKVVRRTARAIDRAMPQGLHDSQTKRMRAQIDARYRGSFARDNAALAAMCGVDLARYGYEVVR